MLFIIYIQSHLSFSSTMLALKNGTDVRFKYRFITSKKIRNSRRKYIYIYIYKDSRSTMHRVDRITALVHPFKHLVSMVYKSSSSCCLALQTSLII